MGFLSYYPEVRDTLELSELGFEKPRQPLAGLLGEEHQAPPMLILDGPPAADVPEVEVCQARGLWFIPRTLDILRYLAATRGVPGPH